jgi:CelD/BcsL family acetyltransferase involved in cellulose biosynthesis
MENMLQYCFRNGIRTFDFMPGEEPYKRIWATDYILEESYIGALNWRGEMLLRLSGTKIISDLANALRDVYRNLPFRWRKAVQRRLRAYHLVNSALNLKLAPKAPPGALLADASSAQSDGDASTGRHRNEPRVAS